MYSKRSTHALATFRKRPSALVTSQNTKMPTHTLLQYELPSIRTTALFNLSVSYFVMPLSRRKMSLLQLTQIFSYPLEQSALLSVTHFCGKC